jgi:hypothetical protein
MSLDSLQPKLSSLLKSLPPRPIEQNKLNELVKDTLEKSKAKTPKIVRIVSEYSKNQWEYLLKNEVFLLAVGARYTRLTIGSWSPRQLKAKLSKMTRLRITMSYETG